MLEAYDQLRSLVVSGELEPGTGLAEIPLAERLGVSRPTVREALRRLESHGLAGGDSRGLRVVLMGDQEIRSALLARSALEALHAELTAQRVAAGEVAPAALRRLAELARHAERLTGDGNYTAAVHANREFHQAIDSLAASPVSAALLDQLWDRIVVATQRSLSPSRGEVVKREHDALLAALQGGESKKASELAGAHVRATVRAADLDSDLADGGSGALGP